MPRRIVTVLVLLGLCAAPLRAQLISAGAGPAYPGGEFKDTFNPGNGFYFSGRANLSFAFLTLQLELAHTSWSFTDTAGDASIDMWQPGANLGFRFIRVGPVRPYVLAGVIGSNLSIETAQVDDSGLHFGYQVGAGIDFKLGPLRPFVEYRWIELDGPGDVNVKYYPLIFGVGIF
jgi:opacity protein-like surface antigen